MKKDGTEYIIRINPGGNITYHERFFVNDGIYQEYTVSRAAIKKVLEDDES